MPVDHRYREELKGVLLAARDLEEALDVGDRDDVTSLASNLLSSALARESGGVVAGFRAYDAPAAHGTVAPRTLEEELSLALAELEIGEVLLASAAATESQPLVAGTEAASSLSEAIDRLDDASGGLAQAGAPAVLNLFGDRQLRPQDFFDQLPATIDRIVKRTADLSLDTVKGLTAIPAAQLQPVFGAALTAVGTALGAAGEVGALVRAGMRAVARAIQALTKLVPENLRQQVRDWAMEWWEQHANGMAEDVIRRVLSVAELQAVITLDIEAVKKRTDIGPALKQGAHRLIELDEQHSRAIKVLERIVGALSRLIGPLVIAFPVAVPWIYGSGGGGMVIALGVSVWIGRDFLDTGVPFEHVSGVRAIVSDATVMPTVSG
jgi:hypothetical protein